jgi:hypothetical protein
MNLGIRRTGSHCRRAGFALNINQHANTRKRRWNPIHFKFFLNFLFLPFISSHRIRPRIIFSTPTINDKAPPSAFDTVAPTTHEPTLRNYKRNRAAAQEDRGTEVSDVLGLAAELH